MPVPRPLDLTLEIVPRARFDLVDLRASLPRSHTDALASYPNCLYCSFHTTAGFFDRSLASRLAHEQGFNAYMEAFRAIFPEGAGYEHDRLERRAELSPAQRASEPRNADSHLAFIASGLRTCVSYPNRPDQPVFFVELDGESDGRRRTRRTRIVGYHDEREVASFKVDVPVSAHPVDSINLKDPRLGLYERIQDEIARTGIGKGRVRLALHAGERHAGLAINEHETLLMRHDLAEVLRDPLRFAIEKGRHALADPRAVPGKTLGYAQYDLVRILNRLVEVLGLGESRVERMLARTMAVPLSRFLRMKRSVSLLISADDGTGAPMIVEGTYQSPIMVQWNRASRRSRVLDVSVTRLR
ncbi:MAG: hypothetical protein HYU53_09035 [Acidobacteria bacterium]|nr:hypothetical protein [Acidobacteriota bacterium]